MTRLPASRGASLVVLSPVEAVTNEALAQPLPARHRLSLVTAARCDLRAVERAVDRVMPLAECHALSDRVGVRQAAMGRLAVSRPGRVHAARRRAVDLRHRRRRGGRWL